MKMRAMTVKQARKEKGKGKPVNFTRNLTPKEQVKKIIRDKTKADQLTEKEIRALVFLLAKDTGA